jgi:predicted metal-binding membrane protein
MQKTVGVTCLVAGVLLIVWGHSVSESVGGQLQKAFTGSPGDKPLWLYVSGAVLSVLGLYQIYSAKK